MLVIGTDVVERYLAARAGHKGIKAARAQYDAWLALARNSRMEDSGGREASTSEGEHP